VTRRACNQASNRRQLS